MLEEKERTPFISISVYFLLFLFLFTEGINEGFITNTLTNGIAVVLMIILVFYALQTMQFSIGRFTSIFFLFLAMCFISVLWAGNKTRVFEVCAVLLRMFVLYALLENFVIRENDIDSLILTVCLSCIAYSIYYILHFGISGIIAAVTAGVRLGSKLDNANAVGCRMALGSILCLWYVIHADKKIMLAGVIATILGVFGTGSRTAIATCMLGVFLLLFIGNERSNAAKKFLLLGITAATVYIILSSGVLAGVSDRFASMFKALSGKAGDGSARVRILMTKYGWKQFLKTPILGIGIGNSGQVAGLASPNYANGYLHNNYIELLVSIGVVGTAIYYSFFAHPLNRIFRNPQGRNAYTVLALTLMLSILLGQLGYVQYTKKYIYAYILLIMQLCKTVPDTEGDSDEAFT